MITRRRPTARVIGLALAATISLVGAACGSDDDDSDASTPQSTAAPTVSTVGDVTTTGGATTVTGSDTDGTDVTDDTDATVAGSSDTTEPGSASTDGGDVREGVKVGLLYDITGRGDKSFNDAAAAGLDKAKDEFGVVGAESTPTSEGDRAERIQLLIDQGNELVIAVGFLWTTNVETAAAANPDTTFAIVDPSPPIEAPNVLSMNFAEEQGSFLVGVAAGLKTKSDKVGFLGGVEIDLIKKFEAGFKAGVAAANPDAEVIAQYITQPPDFNGFNDTTKGKEIAASMYESGADIVYAAAGTSGLGAFQAASEAGAPGEVWAAGVDSDQYNLVDADLKPYVLTSMLKKVDVAVYDAIAAFVKGDFAPELQVFDLERDGVGYSTSGGFVDDIKDQIDGYADQIVSGEIEVPTVPE